MKKLFYFVLLGMFVSNFTFMKAKKNSKYRNGRHLRSPQEVKEITMKEAPVVSTKSALPMYVITIPSVVYLAELCYAHGGSIVSVDLDSLVSDPKAAVHVKRLRQESEIVAAKILSNLVENPEQKEFKEFFGISDLSVRHNPVALSNLEVVEKGWFRNKKMPVSVKLDNVSKEIYKKTRLTPRTLSMPITASKMFADLILFASLESLSRSDKKAIEGKIKLAEILLLEITAMLGMNINREMKEMKAFVTKTNKILKNLGIGLGVVITGALAYYYRKGIGSGLSSAKKYGSWLLFGETGNERLGKWSSRKKQSASPMPVA